MSRGLFPICFALFCACEPQKEAATSRTLKSLAPAVCSEPSAPAPVPLRLLTRAEYDNVLEDLLGDRSTPSQAFAREPLNEGFDNDAAINRPGPDAMKRYLEAAEAVATRAVRDERERLGTCDASADECADAFVRTFGSRFFRRPLETEEFDDLRRVFSDGMAQGDLDTGMEWALTAMLMAPQFLYRDERPSTDPTQLTRLLPYQVATRLSFAIWASTPDDTLLAAVANGRLETDEDVERQVTRMLQDPRAARGKRRFLELWLGLDDTAQVRKDLAIYPSWSRDLSRAWHTSLSLFLDDVIENGNDVRSLLQSPRVFGNKTLARILGGGSDTDLFAAFESDKHRNGLLTQPGFLATLSSPDQSSPVRRGVFVLDKLLCQRPAPPPADANLVPPAPSSAVTTRERFANHSASACESCHSKIDSLGFLFENYDGEGKWRDTDSGQAVDASGEIKSPRDPALAGAIVGVDALAEKLAQSGQVTDCIAKDWLRFALGRALDDGDLCSLYQIQRALADGDGSFDAFFAALARSDAFLSAVAR